MKEFRGIAASPGTATAPAFLFRDDEDAFIPSYFIEQNQTGAEMERFHEAVEKARTEIRALREKASIEAGDEQAAIFDAHLLMLDDPDMHERVKNEVEHGLRNAESVMVDLERDLVEQLSAAQNPFVQERVSDVHDVTRRITGHLMHKERINLADIAVDVVLVARDLLPSDMIGMARGRVKGIVTETGGRTSHAAILARAFEIPAVLGLGPFFNELKEGTPVIVDGDRGVVVVDPDETALKRERMAKNARALREKEYLMLRELPAITLDGTSIRLKANIEVPEEVRAVVEHGADGVGLFRSEFLFLGGHVPGEEEQYRAYRSVVEAMQGKPVTIRTLDIGGDKVLPELGAKDEKNPLLGWRAIRFCLSRTEVFRTQLRAILRSAVHGDVRIMFPMITTADELERSRGLLEEARWECRSRGYPVPDKVPTGIMVEVPSAAICSDILARSADFFSIGTNDLIQYTMAVDRGNEKVAYLNEPYNPAVLRLVKITIDNAKAAGIGIGICGEMAADPAAAVLLAGLGMEEMSMSAMAIPPVKRCLRSIRIDEAKRIAESAMGMSTSAQIAAFLAARIKG
ncbi:MAG: phosphoenolpyruvate--protein phosphotransferase [Rectinema sp.]